MTGRAVPPEQEIEERARVVRIAKEWENTPYASHQMKKGAGCDCITFIVAIYEEAGLVGRIVLPPYSEQWHLSHCEEKYLNELVKYCNEVSVGRAGDIMVVKMGHAFSHGALVTDWPDVFHATKGRGVIRTNAANDGKLINRERKFFSIWQ